MCLTCQIVQRKIVPPGGILYSDDIAVLHHCTDIDILGYLILSPVRHVESFGSLDDAEMKVISRLLNLSSTILEEVAGVKKIYICSFGEISAHFHFHIFPRYGWMLELEDTKTQDTTDAAKIFSQVRRIKKIKTL
ncbi:MAG: histidine triad protein [Massilibacillus sp.]|jgi:diadenosine tetraphosphate (Ap4A) HIT family hydrolase|nr:histidine triad protein [Massilibacillus sp.]